MSDIRGQDPSGKPRDVAVTNQGDVFAAGRVFRTDRVMVPGIGAAAAYASGDAFGGKFSFQVPVMGVISNAVFLDLDDEGIDKEIVLFSEDFTATADNSAFAVSDADLLKCLGVVAIDIFYDFANNQLGAGSPALFYHAPNGRLWCQMVTRGADNIAAGSSPSVFLDITL